ncbi:pilus assembly protein PilC [Neisseria meningitidis]|nr:pilus assembly protein PilC [Neisseria meningitidis]
MNKTWKRQVFRHTVLYTAILMFSHTGGGGGGGGGGRRKRKRKRKRINTLL